MPNIINKMLARELTDSLSDAEGMVIVSMAGLTVEESDSLRTALAEQGVQLRMVRNRIAKIALKERGLEAPAELFKGNVAMTWGSPEDTIHAAKVLVKSDAKKAGKVVVRGGLLEGKMLTPQEASNLAELPGKQELQAMLLGVLSGPARSLVGLIHAPGSSLARVLQAKVDQDGGAEG